MPLSLHDDELSISTELVRRLVDSSFPEYKQYSLNRLTEHGSSNVLFRLGKDLLVRLPRQPGAGVSIEKEYRWLRKVSRGLPVATPEIIAIGKPMFGYSEKWSIVRWIDGVIPQPFANNGSPTSMSKQFALDLADAVRAIRDTKLPSRPDIDASLRCYRGRALAEFDNLTRQNIQRCGAISGLNIDLDAALSVWNDAMKLPDSNRVGEDRWYHGDLVTENLLVCGDGRLCAILDFGSLGIGDATIDSHGVWGLLDAPCRDAFRRRLGVCESEWLLGRAWALGTSLNAITYYWTTMPTRMKDRVSAVQSVIDDATKENRGKG